jgi:hypothetical protein
MLSWRQFVLLLVIGLAIIAAMWMDEHHPLPIHVVRNTHGG